MARPSKQGAEYFPLDCDITSDDKLTMVLHQFGNRGFGIVVRLLAAIYRVGYCYRWGEREAVKFSMSIGEPVGDVLSIVETLVQDGFFAENVFKSTGFLTSKGIQRRFLRAMEKRSDVRVSAKIWLLDHTPNYVKIVSGDETQGSAGVSGPDNPTSGGVSGVNNPAEVGVSGVKSTQSKVKESKVQVGRERIFARASEDFSEDEKKEHDSEGEPSANKSFGGNVQFSGADTTRHIDQKEKSNLAQSSAPQGQVKNRLIEYEKLVALTAEDFAQLAKEKFNGDESKLKAVIKEISLHLRSRGLPAPVDCAAYIESWLIKEQKYFIRRPAQDQNSAEFNLMFERVMEVARQYRGPRGKTLRENLPPKVREVGDQIGWNRLAESRPGDRKIRELFDHKYRQNLQADAIGGATT